MRVSNKFPVAVQTVLIIAALSASEQVTSQRISDTIGVNPTIIRSIFSGLKQAGIIAVSPGPGGAKLARQPAAIDLWQILVAVEPIETDVIFKNQEYPSAHQKIGSNIFDLLKGHFDDGLQALAGELRQVTVAQLATELRQRLPELPPLPDTKNAH